MDLVNLTQSDFHEITKEGTWLVQFWSSWCGPCIDTKHLEEFQLVNPGLVVGRVNSEENVELSARYSVSVVPTYVLFKRGLLVKCLAGIQTKESLQKLIVSD